MTVRCKFMVNSIRHYHTTQPDLVCAEVLMAPVFGEANEAWSKATPQGEIKMLITNPKAIGALDLGRQYFVDISPAD